MSKRKPPTCPFPNAARVHAYAAAVLAADELAPLPGDIIAGHLVKLAAHRHIHDMAEGAQRGLVWCPEKAEASIIFFEQVLHLEAGRPFVLDEWQAFIVGSLFGWYRADSAQSVVSSQRTSRKGEMFRRFHNAYIEIAKGNGKTPLAAGIGLYGLVMDNESAPEIYSAAVSADQAAICFKDAARMIEASPELKKLVQVQVGSLTIPARWATFRPLSSEHKNLDGKRVHMGLIDELHEHPTALVTDKIGAGTKSRRNALIVEITNSGSGRTTVCWAHHDTTVKILQGSMVNDEWFGFIAALDACPKCMRSGKTQPDPKCKHCDDWREERHWAKANPGLDTILPRSYLRGQVNKALTITSQQNIIKRLNFCLWTDAATGWVNMHAWNNDCRDESLRVETFFGRPCWIAIDAANKVDITAMVAVFEAKPGSGQLDLDKLSKEVRAALNEAAAASSQSLALDSGLSAPDSTPAARALSAAGYVCFGRYFVPSDMVANSSAANHENYKNWQSADRVIVTDGARTDFMRIEEELKWWNENFSVQRLAFDPREMSYLIQRVQTWCSFECVEVTQSPAMMSQPMKELEALIAAGLVRHDGDPVLSWMMSNVEQKQARKSGGPVKYYFPGKPGDAQKIDGAVALIMALDSALRGAEPVGEPGVAMLG